VGIEGGGQRLACLFPLALSMLSHGQYQARRQLRNPGGRLPQQRDRLFRPAPPVLGKSFCQFKVSIQPVGRAGGYGPVGGAPRRRGFAGVEILASPPNSSGIVLLQALAALEALAPADPLGADAGQLASILRSGSTQRDRMLADPAFVGFDREQWLGERRIEELVTEARHGLTDPEVPLSGTRPYGDTVAVVTVDADGGAVSLIQSLYLSLIPIRRCRRSTRCRSRWSPDY